MYDPCNKYLLVSRIEIEVNNDLRSLLLGSDSIVGFYRMRRSIEDILCCPRVMSAITVNEESDSRSTKWFPLRQNPLEYISPSCSCKASTIQKACMLTLVP